MIVSVSVCECECVCFVNIGPLIISKPDIRLMHNFGYIYYHTGHSKAVITDKMGYEVAIVEALP